MLQAEKDTLMAAMRAAAESVVNAVNELQVTEPVTVDTAALDAANSTIASLTGQLDTEKMNHAATQSKLDMARTAMRDALAAIG